ncbi:LysR family transcriptional regulator [Streptomyces sp. SAJ15]|uniref:LysR family transcriptional regulator n=1 Tax=Streptomyces sp. SAJ15 TaxID=2011095 RepID=UPI0011863614|nr:LysR substrate-binding domain-containing protein [Streptomyces sp. SAJ15]TVL90282.1 LysR family transcriptional regulator [Streptomyces sp. SAJ15]
MATDPSAHRLRLLLVLAEELHFGRAAKRLFISQPAFSRQIRTLEEHLGVPLVERSTRRVELTPAGEALLPRMRAAVDALDALRGAAEAEARPAEPDRVVLGGYVSGLPALRILVDELRKRHAVPEVEWRAVGPVEQARVVLDGEVDGVACYGPMPEGLRTLRLATEPRFVCLADTHPLADREALTLADLADEPVIGFPPEMGREWRDFWAADPRPDGKPVRYTDQTGVTLEACVSLVSLGNGIRFVSGSSRELLPWPGVRFIPVTDLPPCTALLAWSASRPPSPAFGSLLRALSAYLRTVGDVTVGSAKGDRPRDAVALAGKRTAR